MYKYGLMMAAMMAAIQFLTPGCALSPKQPSTILTEISSNPAGASITLDEKILGNTPLSTIISIKTKMKLEGTRTFQTGKAMQEDFKKRADSQSYYFIVTKDGYRDQRIHLDVDAGIPRFIEFTLIPNDSTTDGSGVASMQYNSKTERVIIQSK